ncbi:MAG: hypothetical protein L3J74_18145 [Bacteroidales bacterium]|nr:hypothetical protein [Bacteroidales bacterium]
MKQEKVKNLSIKLFLGFLVIIGAISCSSNNKTQENKDTVNKKNLAVNTEAYRLMQQKCFICHMEKPNPDKKTSMIAPPMMRVQEHYKPAHQTKEEFVKAVVSFVSNPNENDVLMPGAVRKFNLMPNLGYSKEDIQLIAETLYDADFGNMPKMKMNLSDSLKLNNGKKWKLNKESIAAINGVIEKLNNFQSDKVADYNQLGKEIFDGAKTVLLDTRYKGEILNQVHFFFGSIEGDIHALEASSSVDEGKKLIENLKKQFAEFNNYFE